ncbi:MAG: ABC transporter ATP-binding protein [Anaerolineae bacterium]
MSFIRLNQVSKSYGGVVAVNNVSLQVAKGTLLVLLGRSGCGKTTTLRLIAGLERPDSGEIWLGDQPVSSGSAWVPPEKRHIGMVFQDYALFPHMTVAQNIAFALDGLSRTQQRQRIADMLDLVGMGQIESRYPHQLSGGQQQRVALARALAPSPAVVLLDEPFSNLDAALRQTMREEVRRILREAQATAVFVTHDQEEALRLADKLVIMQEGSVLQSGAPDKVYRYPVNWDVAHFLGEINVLPGIAEGTQADTPLGTLSLANAAHGRVDILLRPEVLDIVPDTEGQGIITDVRYYGFYRLVDVQYNHDLLLRVRIWSQDDFQVGDCVRILVKGDAISLPASEH